MTYDNDYEELILRNQEAEIDECNNCPYAGIGHCRNQCMAIKKQYNPCLC